MGGHSRNWGDVMDLKDRDEFDLLLACIRGEAEGEALWGKLAVACVVRNRVFDKRWADNYKDVLLQPKQFSCFLPGFYRPEIFKREWNEIWWRECKFAAWGVMYNYMRDITQGANHYYSTGLIDPPYWAEGKHPMFRTGGHCFFVL